MAQHQAPDHSGAAIVFERVQPYLDAALVLTSDAIDIDGWLDPVHAQSGDETSPPLSWSAPAGVVSYVLVVEDPDAPRDLPAVHWLLWNIPGSLHELPAGVQAGPHPAGLGGAVQGRNARGEHRWLGMAPPPGHGPHRYWFQLFGLDRRLELDPSTPLQELVNVLKGATVAKGQLVGKFETRTLEDQPSPARTGSYGLDPGPTANQAEIRAGRGGLDRDDPDRHAPHDPHGAVRPD